MLNYYSFVTVSNFSSTFNKIVKMIVDTIATIKMPWGDNSTEVKPIFAIPKYPTYVARNDETTEIVNPNNPNSSNFFSGNIPLLKDCLFDFLISYVKFYNKI